MPLTRINRQVRAIAPHAYEVFTSIHYLGWGVTMFLSPSLLTLRSYQGFKWDNTTYGIMYLVMFAISIIGMIDKPKNRYIAGYVMIVGALCWCLNSISFIDAFPPLTIGTWFYPVFTVFNLFVGQSIIENSRSSEIPSSHPPPSV